MLGAVSALAFAFLQAQRAAPEAEPSLAQVASIELGSVEGRIDHLAYDPGAKRLYVAALGNDTLEVVGLATEKHARSLRGFREPQGVLFLPDVHTLVVTNGRGGECVRRTQEDALSFPVGEDADNLRWSAGLERVVIGYGEGALALVDPRTWTVEARIELGGHPESFQLEPSGKTAWVNVPDLRAVLEVDLAERSMRSRIGLEAAARNYPMALDE